ncbi:MULTISPECIES: sulfite exporter TauE/SafE family protein [unclassified Psychrosphaera]|uniref:sulfite exporter TauE/SafE family protein n=1 Tax=unclassified Psychrosphaera TaxID=2641570 RepID=UPI0021134FCF|nr:MULTISPECIES: sulfite exporter TauE/SafE family protein [unclassified Psychrosphaera]
MVVVALIIGLAMGLFGSGGAILTLPSLIYFLGIEDKVAIIGSLVVVGFISAVTAIPHLFSKTTNFSALVYFAPSGIAMSFLGAKIGSFTSSEIQISVFALLAFLAAIKLLMQPNLPSTNSSEVKKLSLVITGGIVGFFTGFIGVGGGFLIVPSLILLANLSIRAAAATSVVIILLQSIVGTAAYALYSPDYFDQLPWKTLMFIGVIASVGSLSGVVLSRYLSQTLLSRILGVLLILVSTTLLYTKLF